MWHHSLIQTIPTRSRSKILQLMAGCYVLGLLMGTGIALLLT
jgi:hypothetical protein